jgi:hypothetical protein
LYRLRWNVFATLDDVEIRTEPCDQTTNVPLFGHHLANESIANPPFSRVDEVCIGECLNRVGLHHEEEDRYKPPPALTINNEDGSPIALGQFVTEAHAYLNLHMEELKLAKGELYGRVSVAEDGTMVRTISDEPYLPPNIGFFFWRVHAIHIGQIVRFNTEAFAEGEKFCRADKFWARQLKVVQNPEQSREDP